MNTKIVPVINNYALSRQLMILSCGLQCYQYNYIGLHYWQIMTQQVYLTPKRRRKRGRKHGRKRTLVCFQL